MKELEMYIQTHESTWSKRLRHKKIGMMYRFREYLESIQLNYLFEFRKEHAETFLDVLKSKYSESFCQAVYYFVKSVFRYYVEIGELVLNPMESICAPRVNYSNNRKQNEKALQYKLKKSKKVTASERVILVLYTEYGLLASHIVSLKVSDINLQTSMLFVRKKKIAHRLEPNIKKQLITLLSERSLLIPKFDEVFLSKHKRPLTAQYIGALVRRVLDEG